MTKFKGYYGTGYRAGFLNQGARAPRGALRSMWFFWGLWNGLRDGEHEL